MIIPIGINQQKMLNWLKIIKTDKNQSSYRALTQTAYIKTGTNMNISTVYQTCSRDLGYIVGTYSIYFSFCFLF